MSVLFNNCSKNYSFTGNNGFCYSLQTDTPFQCQLSEDKFELNMNWKLMSQKSVWFLRKSHWIKIRRYLLWICRQKGKQYSLNTVICSLMGGIKFHFVVWPPTHLLLKRISRSCRCSRVEMITLALWYWIFRHIISELAQPSKLSSQMYDPCFS